MNAQRFPAASLQPSNDGLHLTEQFESCRLTAYQDSGGIWTIGYGHAGPEVIEGLTITQDQAIWLLKCDYHVAIRTVQTHATVPVSQDEFDALCDFVYNVGGKNFIDSTLLQYLNAQNYDAAADQFQIWDHVKGKVIAGLLRRRLAEKTLFDAPEGETDHG